MLTLYLFFALLFFVVSFFAFREFNGGVWPFPLQGLLAVIFGLLWPLTLCGILLDYYLSKDETESDTTSE